MRSIFIAGLLSLPVLAHAVSMDAMCTFAPSQSKVVAALAGAAGVSPVTMSARAAALGFWVVPHSSGAAILTGSAGSIAGTLGVAAIGPALVTVSLVVGGSAVAIELGLNTA